MPVTQPMEVVIGRESSEFLKIKVLSRNKHHSNDFWEANWCRSEICVSVGGFEGQCHADFQTTDFQLFLQALSNLNHTLKGEAVFETLEGQLTFKMIGDGKGNILLQGVLLDDVGIGNKLEFSLELDQTYLGTICLQLEKIVQEFPVIGTP